MHFLLTLTALLIGSSHTRDIFLYQITSFLGEFFPWAAGVACYMLPIKLYSFLGQGLKQGGSRVNNLAYLTVNISNNYIII